jgi:flagellar basal-body rod protein FlgG
MISSFYTAATGAIELQKGFDVTANNIANVSSTGYKASNPTFADLIYTNINAAQGTAADLRSGHGVKLDKADVQYTSGALEQTDRSLDYAVTAANDFFAVQTGEKVVYTKNGNFHLSVQQDKNYLVSSDGGYVLDSKGQPITVANEGDNLDIGVYTFANSDGLARAENCAFTATGSSGAAQAVTSPEIKKGWLEGSNVNVADEMASVIDLQRTFQFNSKIVQISDEIMQTVNALR